MITAEEFIANHKMSNKLGLKFKKLLTLNKSINTLQVRPSTLSASDILQEEQRMENENWKNLIVKNAGNYLKPVLVFGEQI